MAAVHGNGAKPAWGLKTAAAVVDKVSKSEEEDEECSICFERRVSTHFQPCQHGACSDCVDSLRRQVIFKVMSPFLRIETLRSWNSTTCMNVLSTKDAGKVFVYFLTSLATPNSASTVSRWICIYRQIKASSAPTAGSLYRGIPWLDLPGQSFMFSVAGPSRASNVLTICSVRHLKSILLPLHRSAHNERKSKTVGTCDELDNPLV